MNASADVVPGATASGPAWIELSSKRARLEIGAPPSPAMPGTVDEFSANDGGGSFEGLITGLA